MQRCGVRQAHTGTGQGTLPLAKRGKNGDGDLASFQNHAGDFVPALAFLDGLSDKTDKWLDISSEEPIKWIPLGRLDAAKLVKMAKIAKM